MREASFSTSEMVLALAPGRVQHVTAYLVGLLPAVAASGASDANAPPSSNRGLFCEDDSFCPKHCERPPALPELVEGLVLEQVSDLRICKAINHNMW